MFILVITEELFFFKSNIYIILINFYVLFYSIFCILIIQFLYCLQNFNHFSEITFKYIHEKLDIVSKKIFI